MAKRFNSAARIHTLLKPYVTRADQQAIVVWKEMFGVTEQQTNKAFLSISGRLSTLHEELELVRTGMETTEFSAHLYADMLIGVEKGISVEILHANWGSAVQYFKPEFMRALDFCSEILPDEMQQFNQSDIDELVTLLEALKQELNASQLPEKLVKLIQKHIAIIEQAIADYRIQGYRAIKKATSSIVGDINLESDMLRSCAGESSIMNKLGSVYRKILSVVGKVNPVLETVNNIISLSNSVGTN